MKTIFEFDGKGYLTLTAKGQTATLCPESPSAEFELEGDAEVEAVHSEKEPKEKEKMTPGKIALAVILCILLSPLIVLIFLIRAFGNLYMSEGIAPENFFSENNPFVTKTRLTIRPEAGKNVVFSADKPVFDKKKREYIILPQIKVNGEKASEEAEYSYLRALTRLNYKADTITECALIGIISLALAALGVLFMFHLPSPAENPIFFILCLLASLVLISFPAFAVWAVVRTDKALKQIEKNILPSRKEKSKNEKNSHLRLHRLDRRKHAEYYPRKLG